MFQLQEKVQRKRLADFIVSGFSCGYWGHCRVDVFHQMLISTNYWRGGVLKRVDKYDLLVGKYLLKWYCIVLIKRVTGNRLDSCAYSD